MATSTSIGRQFEVNVFGTVATVKAVLPGMRKRRGGHIFVITSMGGHTTFPGLCAAPGSGHGPLRAGRFGQRWARQNSAQLCAGRCCGRPV
ncbi:SDR family NAD(P)-dependent oxidoreductase [Nocardia sp. NPDC101769]|uniref:SDR family NAD(P)-dependent oxidoreductase n=1 Tax=Nocardia sp. NPDC101769 TaxID=3364333 RepID=UPI0037F941C7